jgi:hypothetical protein
VGVLQVLGAVVDALGSAYSAVRPEVQSAALPVKVSRQGSCVLAVYHRSTDIPLCLLVLLQFVGAAAKSNSNGQQGFCIYMVQLAAKDLLSAL